MEPDDWQWQVGAAVELRSGVGDLDGGSFSGQHDH